MSIFFLMEVEKDATESYPAYDRLDMDRETVYRIYQRHVDQYGNESQYMLISTSCLIYAKKFLRSCRLTEGILIEI